MRRSRLLLGLLPALPAAVAVGACTDAPVSIGLVMKAPLGLLDDAKSITLSVFDAKGVTCDEQKGHVENMPTGSGVQTFELQKSGCAPGVTWCKQIELDQSSTKKIFAIVAKGAAGVTIGEGCVEREVDQDPLEVAITLRRHDPPKCCNDGQIQTGETCDDGVAAAMACDGSGPAAACGGVEKTEVCRCDCTTEEQLLSIDNPTSPFFTNGPPGTKLELAMTFAPGNDQTRNGLHTVFRNADMNTGNGDLHLRVLSAELETIQSPPQLALQMRLPFRCGVMQPEGAVANTQRSPAIAAAGERIAIVYASDETYGNTYELYMNVQGQESCTSIDPVQLTDVGASAPELKSEMPDIAAGGPTGTVLVTWHRGSNIRGMIVDTTAPTKGTEIAIGQGKNARVAGNAKGWVVVYEGANGDIYTRRVSTEGVASASEQLVNAITNGTQDQPDIAMLETGQYIVVWHDANDDEIRFQRYDASDQKVEGDDQEAPLNDPSPGSLQQHPAVAAGLGLFAVAWEDVGGTVSARYVGPSKGFGFNSVTGQNGPFVASLPEYDNAQRSAPAVAIGGGGHVVIGWQASGENHHGVFVRRFPLPPPF
ncbi:hypothetical protein [Polyangium aurulentum]|uniref:hypothetical protein n=1 Tax=Polyangium aurulentum TaxID=2567896 RepID=UPI0010AE3736|nr:hypothetical protein [Polyangium aurulentum]UQA58266.1 hypothetical protein E8A73_044650 [Polyangium aurulentum]